MRAFSSSSRRAAALPLAFLALATLSVALLAIIVMTSPGIAGFTVDGRDYIHAADRMLRGNTPYLPAQLTGQPYSPFLPGAYRYPPFFAQALVPLALLPAPWDILTWTALNAVCYPLAAYLVLGAAGISRRRRAALAVLLPMSLLPVLWGAYLGNAGGLLTLLLAVALTNSGARPFLAMSLGALVKLTPAAALPGLFLAGWRRAMVGAGLMALLVGASLLAAPRAWEDFVTATTGNFAGVAFVWDNYAPANVIAHYLGTGEPYTLARLASLAIAGGLIVWSLLAGWRTQVPVVLFAATLAGLLVPSTMWYHYLALLVPFMALTLMRMNARAQGLLLIAVLLIDLPIAGGPLVVIGEILLSVILARALTTPALAAGDAAA